MPGTVLKVNGTEVSAEGSDQTVINISVTQESSLGSLLRALQQLRVQSGARASPGPAKRLTASCCRGEQKVLGACQILLGILCGAFGALLCFAPYTTEVWSGSPFWTGALLVLSGAVSIVSEMRGTCCWVWLASLLSLASTVAATVAVVIGVGNISWYSSSSYYLSYLCGSPSPSPSPSGRGWGSDDSWRERNCRDEVGKLAHLFAGVRLLLVVAMAAGLCIGLYSLLYSCWALCCRPQEPTEDGENKEPLLPPDSVLPPAEEKARDGQGV
ncbi:transmembrane protein 176B-like [Pelodiscus sinensis]|uniref:transmembrane protein 176B-like n=1 Tax=Pelodiscus sinensis TaxID=13735 RepID=UPI003F6D8E4E